MSRKILCENIRSAQIINVAFEGKSVCRIVKAPFGRQFLSSTSLNLHPV